MHRGTLIALMLSAALCLLAAPARAQDTGSAPLDLPYPELQLIATDYAFAVTPQVPAGLTLITQVNNGQEVHHAQLATLAEGRTARDLAQAVRQGEAALIGMLTFVGGPGVILPGGRSQVILDLQPGHYVALCFVQSPDGIPHLAKGMVQPFEVTGEPAAAPEPEAAGTVTMRDFSFAMPAAIAAGPQVWRVTNEGPEPHEIALIKLAPGVTAEQALAMLAPPPATPAAGAASPAASGPPSIVPVGGMQALMPGLTGWLVLDLEPGRYLAICFIPSPAHGGRPHLELGMIAEFTVEAGETMATPVA